MRKGDSHVYYATSIISLFDVLGFRDIVENSGTADQVRQILETLIYQAKPHEELASMYEQNFTNLSDTIVRTTNILSKTNKEFQVGILFHELLDLIHVHFSLIGQGILVRGCVTVGEVYQDESFVFGPGFNRAHFLEKEVAVYPRIIIDPWVFAILDRTPGRFLLKAGHHDLETEKGYIKKLLRESNDGVWFLDYLGAVSEFDDLCQYATFLEQHKQLIIEKSVNLDDFGRVAVKYNWLAHYHNEVVEAIPDKVLESMGVKRNHIIIAKDEVDTLYEF